MTRDCGRPLHDRVRQLVRFRARYVQVHAKHCRRMSERGRDVVAVADERKGAPAQAAPALRQRQTIRERLTRVFLVGERVHDAQPRRGGRHPFDTRVRIRAHDGAVHPALQIARDVLDRLAAAEGDVGGRLDRVASELAHRDLERRPRAQRRLLEQQRHVTAGERPRVRPPCRAIGLEPRGQVEACLQLGGTQIEDGEEAGRGPFGLPEGHGLPHRHAHVRYSALMRT